MTWRLGFGLLLIVFVGSILATLPMGTTLTADTTTAAKQFALPQFSVPTNRWNILEWGGAILSYAGDTIQMFIDVISFKHVPGLQTGAWSMVFWILVMIGASIFLALILNWIFSRG